MSVPSTQVSGRAPPIGDVNENRPVHRVAPHHGISLTDQSPGIPQELLLRQSGSEYSSHSSSSRNSGTPDPFASHLTSPDDDDPLAIAEAIKGALDELDLTPSSLQSSFSEEDPEDEEMTTLTVPPTSQQNGVGGNLQHLSSSHPLTREGGLPTLNTGTRPGHLVASIPPLSSSRGFEQRTVNNGTAPVNGQLDHGDGDTSLKLKDLSFGDRGREEKVLHRASDHDANETLIGDEVEPSVMREADEFSQFDPSHLTSMLERENLFVSSKSLQSSNRATTSVASSKLASSLPPLSSSSGTVQPLSDDSISKIVTSVRMSSSIATGSRLSACLPVKRNKIVKDGPLARKEVELELKGAPAEGDVSSRSEGSLSFTTASSAGGSPVHTMEVWY